ncbi:GNAT family N-acetyltransferase [Aliinostoc sp. HNIBRCY26]|uniref:GNAT family N-acetyltransferase n=1 Tax=Aliinostoc sp. HNIBRCY26 TaxID=3418997 RepID=UPI003CFF6C83
MVQEELPEYSIDEIRSGSDHLETIIKLGDSNSATLGFLPDGAFRRLGDEGRILGFIIKDVGCVGYILYDTNRHRVKLTHLCVDKQWQGRGIAKLLIKKLKEITSHLYGILLSCRRDYELDGMWASLGFVSIYERPGKSKEGSILTEWWLNYGHPDLLTTLAQQKIESRISVAIDANIFYDLTDHETIDEESKESKVLMSDWLANEIELCLTDEIKNEINRNQDETQRKKLRTIANSFTFLSCTQENFEQACQAIRKFFPNNMSDSDASDLRQLARVIASSIKISFFITRDKRLLNIEEEIYNDHSLLIIHPIDFIIRLDELCREAEYQPVRLAGTNIEKKRVQSGKVDLIINLFLNHAQGERKVEFRKNIRNFLSNPEQFECFIIIRQEDPIILIIYDKSDNEELKIPILRIRDTKLTSTLLRHCIFQSFFSAACEKRQFTRVTDTYLDEQVTIALQEDSFIKTQDGWLRANLAIVDDADSIASYLSYICSKSPKNYGHYSSFVDVLINKSSLSNSDWMADIERILYPAKIIDADISNFIIPIKAWWAKDLFDQELAADVLWGAKEDLALKREVVYYCAKRSIQAPGRILWYVSKAGSESHNLHKLGAIRACSILDEIIIGKPKDLYKKFRRYGIYTFDDIRQSTKDNLDKNIMAIKFSHTELFKNPIKLHEIENILKRKISVQTSSKITAEEFVLLYNEGSLFTIDQ